MPDNDAQRVDRLFISWLQVLVEKVRIISVAEHTRSLPGGGLAILIPRDADYPKPSARKMRWLLLYSQMYEGKLPSNMIRRSKVCNQLMCSCCLFLSICRSVSIHEANH